MLPDITNSYANQSLNCYWSHSWELFKSGRTPKFFPAHFCEAYCPKWVSLKVTAVKACYVWLGSAIVRSQPKIQGSHGFSSSHYKLMQTRSVTLQPTMTSLCMYEHSLSEFDYQDIYFLSPTKYFSWKNTSPVNFSTSDYK